MNTHVRQASLTDFPCDALIVNLFEGVTTPGGGTGAVDRALGGAISEVIREQGFKGTLGEVAAIRTCGAIPARNVVLVGLGKPNLFGRQEVMRASGAATRKCAAIRARAVGSILHGAGIAGMAAYESAHATALGAILGTYEYNQLKTEDRESGSIDSFTIVELSESKVPDIRRGIDRASLVGAAVCFARDLANEPSNTMTPARLADIAGDIAREAGMEIAVKDRAEIESAGLGLLSAVSRGSAVEPRFIEMHYRSSHAQKTVAIIGKGITFDSGGYSLKSADGMYGMKDDMSGAASVLAAMRAVGQAKPPLNVSAYIPATENMIGGRAIHPGDVFKSFAGRTVEINNTDAEGRLILSDAVAYAIRSGADEIVDLATLTGACVVALGTEMSGLFSSDQSLADRLIAAGGSSGELLWQMPLHLGYREMLKSDVADIKNTADIRDAGAVTGALFIHSFAKETPWAHIDLSAASITKDTDLARKGATGAGAGTLVEFLTGG